MVEADIANGIGRGAGTTSSWIAGAFKAKIEAGGFARVFTDRVNKWIGGDIFPIPGATVSLVGFKH